MTSTDSTMAIADGLAAHIKVGDMIEVDAGTWAMEVVKVETVTRFLGKDEALLSVERGIHPYRAVAHDIGAELRLVA
jgi:hypothetical protein